MNFDFPLIPDIKIYGEKATPEQDALINYIIHNKFVNGEEKIVKEAVEFYKSVFKYLKSINLSTLEEADMNKIWKYLNATFNFNLIFQDDLRFEILFRVTRVNESFLENDKVRKTKYLYNPPVELNHEKGIFNRCNSPNTSAFYSSFIENVALRETKPDKGQGIILTTWQNISGKLFVYYPVSHAPIINNHPNNRATIAFNKKFQNHHPTFTEYQKLILEFIASEIVKDSEVISEKKYEYIFSAFFCEKILTKRNPKDPTSHFDMILYPSVAYNHEQDNACILPNSLTNLRPIYLREFRILDTYYNQPVTLTKLPLKLQLLRETTCIYEDKIVWNDD